MISEPKKPLPNNEEFVKFWEKERSNNVMHKIFVLSYLAVAASVAFAGTSIDPTWSWAILLLSALVLLLLLFPIVFVLCVWVRDQRLIRCWNCGFWIGADLQGRDPSADCEINPIWRTVARTGRCTRCDARLINAGSVTVETTRKTRERRTRIERSPRSIQSGNDLRTLTILPEIAIRTRMGSVS